MKKDIVALVPLGGKSKSIPSKNIKNMAGKPLCAWVLDSDCKAVGTDNVFVSTDSREIADVVGSIQPGVSTSHGKAFNYDPLNRRLRQNFEGWIMENGAFYIARKEILQRYECRLGGVSVYMK